MLGDRVGDSRTVRATALKRFRSPRFVPPFIDIWSLHSRQFLDSGAGCVIYLVNRDIQHDRTGFRSYCREEAQWQLPTVEDLTAVQVGHRNFRGRNEVEIPIAGDFE